MTDSSNYSSEETARGTFKKQQLPDDIHLQQEQDHPPPPPPPPPQKQKHLTWRQKRKQKKQQNESTPRTIVFNKVSESPQEYCRNKIRTTKYSPLSFLPKNIFHQFAHNVANMYFLLIVILGAFQIFGVPSPGLAAVPLIVIVCVTAAKDAFEDSRRAVLDAEFNNQYTHILEQVNFDITDYRYNNDNAHEEQVSIWRRFKKATTRCTIRIYKFFQSNFTKKGRANKARQETVEVKRKSFDSDVASPRSSLDHVQTYGEALRLSTTNRSHHHRDKILKFARNYWKNVRVGDVLRIYNNEEVPADCIVLATSDEDNFCYIETKNLDGETNLKAKQGIRYSDNVGKADDLIDVEFEMESESPNPNLYSYEGNITYDKDGQQVKEPLSIGNFLPRGCTLRNTKWVIAIVAYTGKDTKIMLNAGITPTKTSRISRQLNISVILNFVLLFVLCFVSGLVNGLYYRGTNSSRIFFDGRPYGKTPAINGVIAFWVAVIIYQSLVPISLYITIEIIKTAQAYFIYADVKMYYAKLDFPCVAKAWNISDDLGQIEYVFSDKTGTLTQNVMEFRKCTINGKSYGLAYTEAQQGLDKRAGVDVIEAAHKWKTKITQDKEVMIEELHKLSGDHTYDDELTFVSLAFVEDVIDGSKKQLECNKQFMLALALCHTVMTEKDPQNPQKLVLKAQSPDEAALVGTARALGFNFKNATKNGELVDVFGKLTEYEVLNTLEFNSTRKRMSVIVKVPATSPNEEPKALLICKGADSVIFQRLDPTKNSNELVSKTALHLEDYANEGLRTLCIAQRELSWSQYSEWSKRYQAAASSLEDREYKMEEAADSIERNLILLGGTAIEDRLQSGVPQSISILSQAGIKLWVLTGDKVETAINIGFSCNLLENDMKLLVVRPEADDLDNVAHIDHLITKYLKEEFGIDAGTPSQVNKLIKDARKDHSIPQAKIALIIDGAALTQIFQDLNEHPDESIRRLQDKFLLLGKQCKSVLCCRVSPAQKAQVVKMVKNGLQVMTLAVGDGANDVAMIQAANVGVGIAGEEGRQAVMSSDYAIGQFRFLTRLLLVHGRWCYKRLAEMIPCFFYKNVVFTLTCFWYGIYNNFDGSYLYEYTYLMFYNLAFTSLPVIFLGIFDQDVSDTVSLLVPQLYISGILSKDWHQFKFVWYCVDGLYQSVISFYFPYLLFYKSFQNMQGMTIDHRFFMGVVAACIAVTACNIYVLMRQYRWDWLSVLIDVISILLVYFWTGVWSVNKNYTGEFYRAGAQTLGTLAVWCCIFVGIVGCLLPRFTYDFLQSNFRPTDVEIIRERVRKGAFDEYPNGYDPTDAEDVERHRLLTEIIKDDPTLFEKMEQDYKDEEKEKETSLGRTLKSIKRHATIKRSTKQSEQRLRRNTINDQFQKHIPLEELRQQMIQSGEYTSARYSLERLSTTHDIPGVVQADTLLKYHTRNSVNMS
ncbi:Phospholipid-transporting ATPase DNF2 [Candida viswanathii]|uniref:Phospholipid-transporting ATPase n=1 Tax=Candida viswanathii TaxID=5486 RepID=A0A367Y247_9ASCO|nr:Phospholipid-transporting ATPase DNF2 [Candida viswanathii]